MWCCWKKSFFFPFGLFPLLCKMRVVLFCAALWFSNTLFRHLYSQQTLLLALNTLVRMLNYVSVPLGYNLPASPPKVLSRLLKLTNFHGNKVHLQWDHIASYHSVMVPTQIPAWDCCYLNPDKLAGTQSVWNTNTDSHKENIHFGAYTWTGIQIRLRVADLKAQLLHIYLDSMKPNSSELLKITTTKNVHFGSYNRLYFAVQSRFSLKHMLSGFDIQGWSLSTGSCIANEVVNSVLMSGFTVTTSEVKPSELHILPICCGVKGSKGEQTLYI